MNLFGLSITRTKAVPSTFESVSNRGWFPIVIREAFAGAWQRNIEVSTETVLTFAAVYACVTRICMDIGKVRLRLVAQDRNGIWEEVESPAFSPVLRKPNSYQTRLQFFQTWMRSKLLMGNALVLKVRDNRGVVVEMHVLDAMRVRTLVAPDGSVWYALGSDNLAQVTEAVTVPASEIIHDRTQDLYHPLAGVSPISACGLAATQGLRVQEHSSNFFLNGAQPGGILTTPQTLNDVQAASIQKQWEEGFSGQNFGRIAVLGGGFKYEGMSVNAVDAQLIEQLKLSAEMVCTAFGVPAFMVGVGPLPPYNNVEALLLQYYSHTLQNPMEHIEELLDYGLGLKTPGFPDTKTPDGRPYGTEFDVDDLLRMDTAGKVTATQNAIGSGGVSPNEARKRWMDLGPVDGGETPYLQQQNYSLAALAKRDAQDDPFGTAPRTTPEPETAADEDPDMDEPDDMERVAAFRLKAAAIGLG